MNKLKQNSILVPPFLQWCSDPSRNNNSKSVLARRALGDPQTRIKTVFETVLSPQQMVVQWNILLLNFERLSCYMHDNFNKCFIIYWNYGLIYQFCMNLIVSLGLSIMVFHWFRKGCDSWTDRASSWYPLDLKIYFYICET